MSENKILYKGFGQGDCEKYNTGKFGEYDFLKYTPKTTKFGAHSKKISWSYSENVAIRFALDYYFDGEGKIPLVANTFYRMVGRQIHEQQNYFTRKRSFDIR